MENGKRRRTSHTPNFAYGPFRSTEKQRAFFDDYHITLSTVSPDQWQSSRIQIRASSLETQ